MGPVTCVAWHELARDRRLLPSNTEGQPFGRGALFHLLRNPVYLGRISHKKISHAGLHEAILDEALFNAVQAHLDANRVQHVERATRAAKVSLRGRIFDQDGHRMSPTSARGRADRIHRYYVSAPLQRGQRLTGADAVRRVPVDALETLVRQRVSAVLHAGGQDALDAIARVQLRPRAIDIWLKRSAVDEDPAHLADGETLTSHPGESDLLVLRLPIRPQFHGGRTWLVGSQSRRAKVDPVLVAALRTARRIATGAGLIGDASKATAAPANAYERRLALLAFLSPDLQTMILNGKQPAGVSLEQILKNPPPLAWSDQPSWLSRLSYPC